MLLLHLLRSLAERLQLFDSVIKLGLGFTEISRLLVDLSLVVGLDQCLHFFPEFLEVLGSFGSTNVVFSLQLGQMAVASWQDLLQG